MYFLAATLLVGLFALSCASTKGAEGIPQPDWVRNVPKETGDTVYFVGEGRAGSTTTAKKATARRDVDAQIARWVGAKVDAMMKDYVEESGETGNTQALESLRDAVRTVASANTASLKEEKSWVAKDGSYILLFSYSKVVLRSDLKKEFQRNQSAVFSNYEADKMFELMDKELEKF
jgi:hypothetical protein